MVNLETIFIAQFGSQFFLLNGIHDNTNFHRSHLLAIPLWEGPTTVLILMKRVSECNQYGRQ